MNKDNERTLKNLFPLKKIFLIPSEGYSGKNFYSNKNFSKNNIFYISRIIREKGIFNMLKAFIHLQKKYPDISLDVAGEVALNEKDLIEFNQLISNKNITFHGEISENLKYKIFEKVKIFAFPSVYGEGLPRVLLEAQIFKCLTLTTNFPGCEDAISPSMKMFLCSDTLKSTIESLEKAIMLEDKLLLKSITEEAQNWVNDHHNIPNIINKYSKIFSSTNFM
jgi:glycosyltransferase involved in cell wall biosynthesis